jgi:hypothetical protein
MSQEDFYTKLANSNSYGTNHAIRIMKRYSHHSFDENIRIAGDNSYLNASNWVIGSSSLFMLASTMGFHRTGFGIFAAGIFPSLKWISAGNLILQTSKEYSLEK